MEETFWKSFLPKVVQKFYELSEMKSKNDEEIEEKKKNIMNELFNEMIVVEVV